MRKSRGEKLGFAAVLGAMLMSLGTLCASAAGAASIKQAYTAPAPPKMTEAAARKHITDENYTDVTDLRRVKDGWSAQAKSLGSPVSLIISNMGDIDQQ